MGRLRSSKVCEHLVLPQLCALARTLTRLHRTSRRHSSMQRRPWRRPARGCPSTQSCTSLLQAQIRTEPADVTVPYSRNTKLSGTELRPQYGTFTDPRRHQYSVQCHALPEIETVPAMTLGVPAMADTTETATRHTVFGGHAGKTQNILQNGMCSLDRADLFLE